LLNFITNVINIYDDDGVTFQKLKELLHTFIAVCCDSFVSEQRHIECGVTFVTITYFMEIANTFNSFNYERLVDNFYNVFVKVFTKTSDYEYITIGSDHILHNLDGEDLFLHLIFDRRIITNLLDKYPDIIEYGNHVIFNKACDIFNSSTVDPLTIIERLIKMNSKYNYVVCESVIMPVIN